MRHPVLRLSFGSGNFKEPGYVEASLMEQLAAVERRATVVSEYSTAPGRFAAVLEALHGQAGQSVAVLIDEYDKPILDALETPEIARANRDFLRGLYAVVKDSDAHIRFSFITGVSKFSKVSLFSGLNNLKDITLDPRYSSICGYTDADLDAVFAAELPGLDRDRIRDWYNGYGWLGDAKVYNPFDILLLFDKRKFGAWWFETGTPTFLVETLFKRQVSSLALDEMVSSGDLLSTFDVNDMATEALLFQTGYVTILGEEDLGGESLYRLGYPNREVRQSLNRSLLRYLVRDSSRQMANSVRLYRLLEANDFAGLEALFQAFFASIPDEWYTNNDIADYDGYYASVFYSYFASLGLDITVEDSSSHGRLVGLTRSCGRLRAVVTGTEVNDSRWKGIFLGDRCWGSPPRVVVDLRLTDPQGLESARFAMPLGARRALRRGGAAFEFVRAQVPQRGVQAPGVVKRFHEREDGHARLGLVLERAPLQQLAFERGEKAFRHRVVVAVSGRAGRGDHPHLPASLAEGQRRVLRTLVGMMDDPLGAALPDRHVQRLKHQLGAKMVGHGPPHHLAAEHVEHDGQVQKPRRGRHVGDIGHPDAVWRIGPEHPFHPVRGRATARLRARGARAPAPAHPGQARLAHQPRDAFAAHPASAREQLRVHSRHPVRAMRIAVDAANHRAQLLVATGPTRPSTTSPRGVPAGGDAQHPAHRGHPMTGLVCAHEPEDLPGTEPVSRANQAVAFAKMSRSSRTRRSSRRSRRSSSRSELVSPSSRRPWSRSA